MARPAAPRRLPLLPADSQVGWTAYVWLVYLVMFLAPPAAHTWAGRASIGEWAATLLGLAIFLFTYFRAYWVRGRGLVAIVAAQVALGVIYSTINPGALVFFVYAACFIARLEERRDAVLGVALVTLALAGTAWLAAVPWIWLTGGVIMAPLLGAVNYHDARVARADRKLRLAQEQIEHLAAVAERERIARDLHDVLGHTLSLIVLKAELAGRLAERAPARAAAEVRDIEQVARQALREVREAIRGYRASVPDEAERARALLAAAGVDAELDIERVTLDAAIGETLALALREAVTNVIRHARAGRCRVRLHALDDACVLEVEDDGRGCRAPEGGGRRGMRERVEALGGTVERGPGTGGRGTRLRVTLPLARVEIHAGGGRL